MKRYAIAVCAGILFGLPAWTQDVVREANNRAVELLEAGRVEEARDLLRRTIRRAEDDLPAGAMAGLYYNYARTLYESGEMDACAKALALAVRLEPGLDTAVNALLEVGREAPRAAMALAPDVIEALLDHGRFDMAGRYFRLILDAAEAEERSRIDKEIAEQYADYCIRSQLSPERFRAGWYERFTRFPASVDKDAAVMFRDMARLYTDDFPMPPAMPDLHYGAWKDALLSDLAVSVGDRWAETGDEVRALQRYHLAWRVNEENLTAALYMANLLIEAEDDPADETVRRVSYDRGAADLAELIDRLFTIKGGAYASGDLENIIRLHTVLGTIYQQQGKWGDSSDPYSAVFQWEHAVQKQREWNEQHPDSAKPMPGLHENLAKVYEAVGEEEKALEQFEQAGEKYVELKRAELAERVVQEMSSFQQRYPDLDRSKLDDLAIDVETLKERAVVDTQLPPSGPEVDAPGADASQVDRESAVTAPEISRDAGVSPKAHALSPEEMNKLMQQSPALRETLEKGRLKTDVPNR